MDVCVCRHYVTEHRSSKRQKGGGPAEERDEISGDYFYDEVSELLLVRERTAGLNTCGSTALSVKMEGLGSHVIGAHV